MNKISPLLEGGEEILMPKGKFHFEFDEYRKGKRIRSSRGSRHTSFSGEEGAPIYVCVGQLGAVLIGQNDAPKRHGRLVQETTPIAANADAADWNTCGGTG